MRLRLCLPAGISQDSFQIILSLLQEETPQSESKDELDQDKVYLDLTPVKSFLHSTGRKPTQPSPPLSPSVDSASSQATMDNVSETTLLAKEAETCRKSMEIPDQVL